MECKKTDATQTKERKTKKNVEEEAHSHIHIAQQCHQWNLKLNRSR